MQRVLESIVLNRFRSTKCLRSFVILVGNFRVCVFLTGKVVLGGREVEKEE